jgi:hypothetical protein
MPGTRRNDEDDLLQGGLCTGFGDNTDTIDDDDDNRRIDVSGDFFGRILEEGEMPAGACDNHDDDDESSFWTSVRVEGKDRNMDDDHGTEISGNEDLFRGSLLRDYTNNFSNNEESSLCGESTTDSSLCGESTTDSSLCGESTTDSSLCGESTKLKRPKFTEYEVLMQDLDKHNIVVDAIVCGVYNVGPTTSIYHRGEDVVRDRVTPLRPMQRTNNVKGGLTILVHAVFMVFNNWGSSGGKCPRPAHRSFEVTITDAVNFVKSKVQDTTQGPRHYTTSEVQDTTQGPRHYTTSEVQDTTQGPRHHTTSEVQDTTQPVESHNVDVDVGSEIKNYILNSTAGVNYKAFTKIDATNKHANLVQMVWGHSVPPGADISVAYSQIVCVVSAFVLLDYYAQGDIVLKNMTHTSFERFVGVSIGEFLEAYNNLGNKCRALILSAQGKRKR